tara:strand:- start:7863 stop:8249 length:387 start_codon:yes stop_codon:yes gene_type:complete
MKKDQDYIVKVEKAIAQKYGADTIQNPRGNWDEEKEKEYLQQLKEETKKNNQFLDNNEKAETDGFFVNKKLLTRDHNRTCPVCNVYSFNKMDDAYMVKFQCCFNCYVQWVEEREERWLKGWRPNKEEK